jgi:hypothetical protein
MRALPPMRVALALVSADELAGKAASRQAARG